ncbi:MAG: hypothetical protein IJ526_05175 [Lachnospiraceae bacterium]|nr:hypothetical protein [Lachnospiraceae bacterium]
MKECNEKPEIRKVHSLNEIIEEQRKEYLRPITKEDMQNEFNYFRSIQILKKMLDGALITQEEYNKIDSRLIDLYHPMYYQLFPNYKKKENV